MRKILALILVLFTVGCANRTPKLSTNDMMDAWSGKHSSEIITSWGQPDWNISTSEILVWRFGLDTYMFWVDDQGILTYWSVDKSSILEKLGAITDDVGTMVEAHQAQQEKQRQAWEEQQRQQQEIRLRKVEQELKNQQLCRDYGIFCK